MNKKTLNIIKNINRIYNSNLPMITYANIEAFDGNIILKSDGIPSSILIQYTGAVYFKKNLPITVKVIFSKNTILITNIFKDDLNGNIFEYYGNIKITSCRILNFNNSSVMPTINNKQQEDIIQATKTNLEDDNLILHDTGKTSTRQKVSRGVSKPFINQVGMEKIDSKSQIKKQAKAVVGTAIKVASKIKISQKPISRATAKKTTSVATPSRTITRKVKY